MLFVEERLVIFLFDGVYHFILVGILGSIENKIVPGVPKMVSKQYTYTVHVDYRVYFSYMI